MNEQHHPSSEQPHAGEPPRPNPYNLDDFPAYRDALLGQARTEQEKADIEQTFDPDNPGALEVLADPEYSEELTSGEHEREFNELYPALEKVMVHHEQRMEAEALGRLRQEAHAAGREALGHKGSFMEFWDEAAAAAKERDEIKLADVYLRNGERLRAAQKQLFERQATLADGAEWSLRLGGLSKARGAEAVMVYAANLPLKEGQLKDGEASPAEQLLMSGAMLSEASLLNSRYGSRDEAKQQGYEAAARQRFDEIIAAAQAQPDLAGVARQARVYRSDLDMREAHRLALAAKLAGGDAEREQRASELAAASMKDLVACIEDAKDDLKSSDTDIRDNARGELVERAILLLLRRHAAEGGRLADELPYQAFPRQDYPHDRLKPQGLPREAFDVVQTRVVVREGQVGQLEVPIQAKNRSRVEDVYHADIVPLANSAGQVLEITKASLQEDARGGVMQAAKLDEFANALARRIDSVREQRRAARRAA